MIICFAYVERGRRTEKEGKEREEKGWVCMEERKKKCWVGLRGERHLAGGQEVGRVNKQAGKQNFEIWKIASYTNIYHHNAAYLITRGKLPNSVGLLPIWL